MNEDNRRFYLTTEFEELDCGCIRRGDGVQLRYCGKHNVREGTHFFGDGIVVENGQ